MKNLKAIRLTAEQIKADEGREYNPQVWVEKVDRMTSGYSDVEFFKVLADDCFQYNRYYVKYRLDDGLLLFKSFGYSSTITSNGFVEVLIGQAMLEDGQIVFLPPNEVNIAVTKFNTLNEAGEREQVAIKNCPEGRAWMTERSKTHYTVFTNSSVY